MPTGYVKKLAKKHHTSVGKSESRWERAKKQAAKQGHSEDFAYVTGIYKKMMGEDAREMSLKQFLVITEMDDVVDISYGSPDDDEEDLDIEFEPDDETGEDELDIDFDTDELDDECDSDECDIEDDHQLADILGPEELEDEREREFEFAEGEGQRAKARLVSKFGRIDKNIGKLKKQLAQGRSGEYDTGTGKETRRDIKKIPAKRLVDTMKAVKESETPLMAELFKKWKRS